LWLVSDEPGVAGEQPLVSRLRSVIGVQDEQIAALEASLEAALAGLEASRERERRLELRVAELERRLGMDSTDSGTPSSRERIGAKAARRARQQSERERRKDCGRGGQPGHEGKSLQRDPDPDEQKDAEPLSRLAGIQQCCAHIIRRCRAVTKLGPGGVQSWAGDIITILREAHHVVKEARARGSTALDPQLLQDLRERYDQAVAAGIIHNRLRDWDTGNHPRVRARLLAARLQGTGLPVHPRSRRRLDERSGFTLHLPGALRSIGAGVVVVVSWCSYCRVCL
jgi:hypothetical protein